MPKRTSQAVSGAEGIPVGYAGLAAVYLAVGVGVFWLLRRLARKPVEMESADPATVGTGAGSGGS